ncbi:MAG: hypothetical protein AAF717_16675 [Bacteroidota bacterium]
MKKDILLTTLLVFLVIMNSVLLFLVVKPGKKTSRPSKTMIADQLEFNEAQLVKFEIFNEQHHQKMQAIDGQSRMLKEQLFQNLEKEAFQEKALDSLAERIGVLAKAREIELFHYFDQISAISNDRQRRKLKQLITGALRHRPPGNPPPPHGPPPPHN